jgi:putative flippase GtrA
MRHYSSLATPDMLADDMQDLALLEREGVRAASASGTDSSLSPLVRLPLPGGTRAAPCVPTTAPPRLPRRTAAIEFMRYFAASGGALAVDVGLYRLALHQDLPYPVAALIGFCAGAVVAYLASVMWVFETRSVRSAAVEFGLFIAVGAAGLLLTETLLWLQIEQFRLPALWSKVGAAGVVFVFNFVVRKTMLFSACSLSAGTRPARTPSSSRP